MAPHPEYGLPPEVAVKFLKAAQRKKLVKGQELFGLGSSPQAMFGLISGRMQVSMFSDDGRKFLAAQLSAGHWFGEVPLLDDEARAFHAEAVEATEVAILSATAFWDILNSDASVLLPVTRLVCSRYRAALSWIEDASLKPFPARLATRLLILADKGSSEVVHLSQETLAFQLGVARQTVNKQLKVWERQGLLRLQYASVLLRDISALRRISSA